MVAQSAASGLAGAGGLVAALTLPPRVVHTNPNVPQDEDGTGSEALFAGLNDAHAIELQAHTLLGNSEDGDGPAEGIELAPPLVWGPGARRISIGQSVATQDDIAALTALITSLQLRVTGDEANIAANTAAIAALQTSMAAQIAALQTQLAAVNERVQILYDTLKPGSLFPLLSGSFGGLGGLGARLALPTSFGASVFAGTGALAATLANVKYISAGLNGAGTLAARFATTYFIAAYWDATTGGPRLQAVLSIPVIPPVMIGNVQFTGAGTLLAMPGTWRLIKPLPMVAAGSLTAQVERSLGSFNWLASGILAPVPLTMLLSPQAGWLGTGALTPPALTQLQALGAGFSGAGVLTAALGNKNLNATLAGAATLAGSLLQQQQVKALLAGSGALAAAVNQSLAGKATLAGAGALTPPVLTPQKSLSSTLAGAGTLIADLTRPGVPFTLDVSRLDSGDYLAAGTPIAAGFPGAGLLAARLAGSFNFSTLFGGRGGLGAVLSSPSGGNLLTFTNALPLFDLAKYKSFNDSGWQGYNLRQVIGASDRGTQPMPRLRIYIMTAPGNTSTAQIDSAYIGFAASSGDPYDFDGGQVPLTFNSGASSANIGGAGMVYSSDYVNFQDDLTKKLVISLHFSDPGASPNVGISAGINLNTFGVSANTLAYYAVGSGDESSFNNVSGYTTVINGPNSYVGLALSTWLGSGALAVTALQQRLAAQATLTGVGTLAAASLQSMSTSAAMAAAGALTASALQNLAATAALPGAGALTATALQQQRIAATLAGAGVLAASVLSSGASAGLIGAGGLTAAALQRMTTSATLAGTGAMASNLQKLLGTALLAGAGALSAKANQGMASSQSMAGAGGLVVNVTIPSTGSTFDPANTSTYATLSNGNLTVAGNNSTHVGQTRGTVSRSSGLRYFEVTLNAIGSSSNPGVGICTAAWVTSTANQTQLGVATGAGNSFAVQPFPAGGYYTTLADSATGTFFGVDGNGAFTPTVGDTIMIAVDTANHLVWWGVNNTWNNTAGPAGGADYTLAVGGPYYIAASVDLLPTATRFTINVGGTAFKYTLPSGFVAWG